METQQQPAGEVQNSQKPFYKKWWGVLLVILFLPIFGIWFVWTKTAWSKRNKWIATVAIVIFSFVAMGSDHPGDGNKSQQAKENTPTPTQPVAESQQAPEKPKAIFDVPSLIGKSIDEVKGILGEPTKYTAPTKQQLEVFPIWDMEYTKDDTNLLVTYNPKSKVITDFFMDGSDQQRLLALGNLQEKSDNYIVETVKAITKPSEITGIKIMKKLPSELDGSVAYNAIAFQITNNEDYDWTNCRLAINGGIVSSGYEYKTSSGIKAKDKLVVPFSEFTKDSERFNFLTNKPENLFVACDTNGQHRTNYFSIK